MLKSHEDVGCIQDYDDEEDDELNYVERKTLSYLQIQKKLKDKEILAKKLKDKEILAKKLLKNKAFEKLHRNCFLDESDEYDYECNCMKRKKSKCLQIQKAKDDDEENDELNYVERKRLTYLQTQKQLKDKEVAKKLHRNCFLDESDEYDYESLKDIEIARKLLKADKEIAEKLLKDKETIAEKLMKDKKIAEKYLEIFCYESDESDWECNYMKSKKDIQIAEKLLKDKEKSEKFHEVMIEECLQRDKEACEEENQRIGTEISRIRVPLLLARDMTLDDLKHKFICRVFLIKRTVPNIGCLRKITIWRPMLFYGRTGNWFYRIKSGQFSKTFFEVFFADGTHQILSTETIRRSIVESSSVPIHEVDSCRFHFWNQFLAKQIAGEILCEAIKPQKLPNSL